MGNRRYFISYTHRDPDSKFLASALYGAINDAGHYAFLDLHIPLGANWVTEIEGQINACDFFIVLIATPILSSEMVQSEVRLAYQRYKQQGVPSILPIRVNFLGRLDYELESYLQRFQFKVWRSPSDTQEILKQILGMYDVSNEAVLLAGDHGYHDSGDEGALVPGFPRPSTDPRVFSPPGGTMRQDDPFYLARPGDIAVKKLAHLHGETVVIKAPRQMGKSSLLVRYLLECAGEGKKIAFLDLSLLAESELQSYSALLTSLAALISRSLRLEGEEVNIERQVQFTYYIEDRVLAHAPHGIVFAFDEADRLLGRKFQRDFFTLLRAWHNMRAEPMSKWCDVDLSLAISTEPYLLIDSEDRSPFNVTSPIELGPFSREQYGELNKLYGAPISESESAGLHGFMEGHPYLGRLAFYALVASSCSLPYLLGGVTEPRSPFGDHLRAMLMRIGRDPVLLDGVRQLFIRQIQPASDVGYRLSGAGLVKREAGLFRPANRLYEAFFRSAL